MHNEPPLYDLQGDNSGISKVVRARESFCRHELSKEKTLRQDVGGELGSWRTEEECSGKSRSKDLRGWRELGHLGPEWGMHAEGSASVRNRRLQPN